MYIETRIQAMRARVSYRMVSYGIVCYGERAATLRDALRWIFQMGGNGEKGEREEERIRVTRKIFSGKSLLRGSDWLKR